MVIFVAVRYFTLALARLSALATHRKPIKANMSGNPCVTSVQSMPCLFPTDTSPCRNTPAHESVCFAAFLDDGFVYDGFSDKFLDLAQWRTYTNEVRRITIISITKVQSIRRHGKSHATPRYSCMACVKIMLDELDIYGWHELSGKLYMCIIVWRKCKFHIICRRDVSNHYAGTFCHVPIVRCQN